MLTKVMLYFSLLIYQGRAHIQRKAFVKYISVTSISSIEFILFVCVGSTVSNVRVN